MARRRDCKVEGCTRPVRYPITGWCHLHYHRWYRHGSTDDPTKPIDWWEPIKYRSAHKRTERTLGKAREHLCVACGAAAEQWAYDGTDPTELREPATRHGRECIMAFSRFPEFYMPMCEPCHKRRDITNRRDQRTTCSNGHSLTPENVYLAPATGYRECRACRRQRSRNYRSRHRPEALTRGDITRDELEDQ